MGGRGCNGDMVERIRETCSFVICGAFGTSGLIVASERSHSPSRPSDCLSVVRLVDYEDVCYLLLASRRDGRRFHRLLPALENTLDEYMEGFITLRSDVRLAQICEVNALARCTRGPLIRRLPKLLLSPA